MKKRPAISVVVPVYNAMKYLDRCVNSILKQTYKDFEIILVDDGSPDSSGIMCDEYSSRYENVLSVHKENGGVSSARNAGIEKAQGEWLCFIDSDDYIEQNYLENFGITNDDVQLLAQGYKVISGAFLKQIGIQYSQNMSQHELFYALENCNILNSPCFKLYKRAIIIQENIRFDHNLSYGEDHLFTLQYMQYVTKALYRDGFLYAYVHNDGNGSLTTKVVPPKAYLLYLDKIIPMMKKYSTHNSFTEKEQGTLINKRVHFHILHALMSYSKTESDRALLKQIKTSLKYHLIEDYGLSKNQRVFVGIVNYLNTRFLDVLLRLNYKYEITRRVKFGF